MNHKITDSLFSIFLGFVPLPIFINLWGWEFIYDCPSDDQLLVPLNIGTIIISVVLCASILSKLTQEKIWGKELYGLLFAAIFSIYYLMIGGDFLRMIQMLLPLVFVNLVFISDKRFEIGPFFFIPMTVFVFLHLLSYFCSEMDGIDKFTYVIDFCVYQSLVTYPSVLALFSLTVLFFMKSKASFILITAIWILDLLSQRKLAMLDLTLLSLILILFSKSFRPTIASLLIFIFVINNFLEPSLFGRLFDSIAVDDLSSGRYEIQQSFFSSVDTGSVDFYIGYGVKDKPGMHNFVLNIFYATGAVGIVLYFTPLLLTIFYMLKKMVLQYGLTYVICVSAILITSATINASITQPYFISNFILMFFIWRPKCLNIKSYS